MYNYLGFVLNAIQLADSASSIAPAWSVINAPGTKSWNRLVERFRFHPVQAIARHVQFARNDPINGNE